MKRFALRDHKVAGPMSWVALAALVCASVVAAGVWRSEVEKDDRQSFRQEATGVSATITSSLRRLDDLMVVVQTRIGTDPSETNRSLERWYRNLGARERFKPVFGFTFMERTPRARLGDFERRLRADPPAGGMPGNRFAISPAGTRPYYCPLRYSIGIKKSQAGELPPPGYDLCGNNALRALLEDAAASSQFRTLGFDSSRPGSVIIAAPVYRTGRTPASEAQRRRQTSGWVAALFDIRGLLRDGLRGHPDMRVALSRQDLTVSALQATYLRRQFKLGGIKRGTVAGARPEGEVHTHRESVDADGRWNVEVTAPASRGGLSPDAQGLIVLLAGLLISCGVFALLRSRMSALAMVEHRTRELRHLAMHDSLTGLPNRALVADRAEQMLAAARRKDSFVAAMFLDLDGFKQINDTFGHGAGDIVLREASQRVRSVLRETDTLGRIGGDEFVVVVGGDGDLDGLERLAERILDAVREPFEVDGQMVSITASVGIAAGARDTAKDLLRDADVALLQAKISGKNRYQIFHAGMQDAAADRFAIELDLRRGLDTGQFFVQYQPVYDTAAMRIRGLETLLRWRHPERGVVGPQEFIGIAEESGLIVDIGRWVLVTACEQGARWDRQGHTVRISVNVSGRQLQEPDFVDSVHYALENTGFEPKRLIIEITESVAVSDPELTRSRLEDLRAVGVAVAIDDFGTGYSSLAYLKDFPVDGIKIDRSFVADIDRTPAARSLVRALVQLGRSMRMAVVAEGIETEAQLQLLREEECEAVQGFLLARPMSADDATHLLEQEELRGSWQLPDLRTQVKRD